jgi:predicted nucleic acid-binding Zn ribbon protein
MPIHVYECPKGHRDEVIERVCDEHKRLCEKCYQRMSLSAAVKTGTPVMKKGSGGFYKPSRD